MTMSKKTVTMSLLRSEAWRCSLALNWCRQYVCCNRAGVLSRSPYAYKFMVASWWLRCDAVDYPRCDLCVFHRV